MESKKIFLGVVVVIALSQTGFAHLDAGEDKVIRDYRVDFGYSPENLAVEDQAVFSFNLANTTTEGVIEPTSVWVRIAGSQGVLFAGTFHPESQHVAFTYTFPYAGNYEITARFKDDKATIVETGFEIEVEGGKTVSWQHYLAGVLILIAAGFVIMKRARGDNKRRRRGMKSP